MKVFYLLAALFFSALGHAKEKTPTATELEAFARANNEFNRSLVNLTNREKYCKESATILPANTFQGLNISPAEKKTALRYYYLKASADCSDTALRDYLVSSGILTAMLYPVDPDRASTLQESQELILDTQVRLLEVGIEYERLDEGLRESLEKIDDLEKPFKLIESSDALGLK